MDLDILEQEADDLLSVVDRRIRRRRFGAPVRLVALRTTILVKIDEQRERAKAGRPARIFAKLNSLVQGKPTRTREPATGGAQST